MTAPESEQPSKSGGGIANTSIPPLENEHSLLDDFNKAANCAFERSARLGEELAELTKGNMNAFVASSRAATQGAEVMRQEAADYSKKSFDSASGALRHFASAKSPIELLHLQSAYAETSIGSAIAEVSRFGDAWLKLVGDVIEPISSCYTAAFEKIDSAAR